MCAQLLSCYIKCNEVSIASMYWSAEQLLWTMITRPMAPFPLFPSHTLLPLSSTPLPPTHMVYL